MNITTRTLLCILFLPLFFYDCSQKKESASSSSDEVVKTLAPQAFKDNLASTTNAILIDVRTPEEVAGGMIQGATNIDYKDPSFADKINQLDKGRAYFVYCKSGKRSGDAVKQMEEREFKDIYVLEGGLQNWEAQGLETVKP